MKRSPLFLLLLVAFVLACLIVTTYKQASGDTYSVVGRPSISAAFIDEVLASYHSPAHDTGTALYGLGIRYGIDPAFALAFFQHESTFGTAGMARSTLSLGNVRCIDGYACSQGYAAFASWQQGYEAWYVLIRHLYVNKWRLRTVAQIIPVYAPASDQNSPSDYINAVEQSVDVWRSGRVAI